MYNVFKYLFASEQILPINITRDTVIFIDVYTHAYSYMYHRLYIFYMHTMCFGDLDALLKIEYDARTAISILCQGHCISYAG